MKTLDMKGKSKFYSQTAIGIATYFGGPLAAGILVRRNSLNLEREKEGLTALIVGIVSTVLLFGVLYLIPEPVLDKIPNALIPAIYTGIIYLIVRKIHGKILDEHKKEGTHGFYSNWRAAGIGLVCAFVLLGGLFAYGYYGLMDWDTKTYDSELAKFHRNESEALKLRDLLNQGSQDNAIHFIAQTGIPKWKENVEIVNKMSCIENLPEAYQRQNELLLEYSKLRLETYELMLKAALNESSEYTEEIVKKHARIDEIIDEL